LIDFLGGITAEMGSGAGDSAVVVVAAATAAGFSNSAAFVAIAGATETTDDAAAGSLAPAFGLGGAGSGIVVFSKELS
jgi:hypothetical protein